MLMRIVGIMAGIRAASGEDDLGGVEHGGDASAGGYVEVECEVGGFEHLLQFQRLDVLP